MSDIKVTLNAVKIVTVLSNGSNVLAYTKTEVNNLLRAVNITNTPSGNISSTTVQGAINELDTEKASTSHTHDDRYYTETEVNTLLNAKANTAQEAWITATLLNGATGALRYAKNQLGIVTVIFEITIGTGTAFTQLSAFPTSYRPIVATSFNNVSVQAFNETNNTVVNIGLNSAGSFYNAQTLTTGHKIRGTFMFYAG